MVLKSFTKPPKKKKKHKVRVDPFDDFASRFAAKTVVKREIKKFIRTGR